MPKQLKLIKTPKQFETELADLRRLIRETAHPLPKEDKQERIRKGEKDFFFFCRTYFPHYATHDFADCHHKLIRKLKKRGKFLFSYAMPRDWAKTVIAHTIFPIWEDLYQRRHFYIHVSKTAELAADTLEFIKLEFEDNARLIQDFGNQQVLGAWEYGDFVTKSGMRYLALGLRSTKRGHRFRQWRPDLIGVDDIDDDERCENQKLITRDLETLEKAIFMMLDDNGTMCLTGNKIHRYSILSRFQREKSNYNHTVVRAIERDKKGQEYSSWPDRKPLETLQAQRAQMDTMTWKSEMQNDPLQKSDLFQAEWFRGADPEEIRCIKTVQYLDPAIGKSDSADLRAHIVVGLDEISGDVIVLDATLNRNSLAGMVDDAYALHERWRTMVAGMEDVLFQKLLWKDFQEGSKRHDYALPNRGVENTIPKDLRIQTVAGPIELGQIRFLGLTWQNRMPVFTNPHMKDLYEQLVFFPNHDKKDGPDALAGAFRLLNENRVSGAAGYRSVKKRRMSPRRAS